MTLRLIVAAVALALAACATQAPRTPPAGVPQAVHPSGPGAAPRSPGESIAANAAAMTGQPYRWGGAAPGGFDCSGLVAYAAGGAGIVVPRTTAEQIHIGVAVPRAGLRPGDLVFMRLAHKGLHVGVAIDRDRFVHAPSSGNRVRIDSLSAAPYARGFVVARRIAR